LVRASVQFKHCKMEEKDRENRPGAQRTARWRDRRRRGFKVYQIEICAADLDGLVARSLLKPVDRDDPTAVELAIGKLLDRLCR
jgi:hypothetical protein